MKQEYDRIAGGLDNAIRSEKSRQAVRKLTEEGSMLLGMEKSKLKSTLMTQYGLNKTETNKLVKAQQDTLDFFNANPSNKWKSPQTFDGTAPDGTKYSTGAQGWDAMMRDNLVDYYTKLKNNDTTAKMDSYLMLYAKQSGYNPSDVVPGASNIQ
jgi:hypothetical protein